MSTSGALKFRMANGQVCDGAGMTADGRVFLMTVDAQYKEVHPMIVEAFAKNLIPTGIWLAAYAKRVSDDPNVRKMGAIITDLNS
jgi:hypothetical protein